MKHRSAAFVSICFFSMLIAGCLGQSGHQSQNTEVINGLSFTPPQGFTKTGEGVYTLKNGTNECIVRVMGVSMGWSNQPMLEEIGTKIKSNMVANGLQVVSMEKTQVNSHDALLLKVAMGGLDQTQYVIRFKNNYAVVQFGTTADCASSMEEILQTVTSVAEQ